MRQSELFTNTQKQPPRGEESVNAKLLEQAGYINKLMAGVYSYLPMGYRVLNNVENIIREEMNAIGGQEVFLPALQPKDLWDKTNRWEGLKDVMYQFTDHSDKPVGLAVTHEEVVADIVRKHVSSYRDLPFAMYQIQTKFRHELRPKSGLNRGREFSMKDLYSLHATKEDLDEYYEIVKKAYLTIFKRCGLDAIIAEASGGDFSDEFSHEFQVFSDAGEDTIIHCAKCDYAQNKEVAESKEGEKCPSCKKEKVQQSKGIEVGNIFKLGTKYSEGIGATFVSKDGKRQPIIMASYGIGPSRVMGTIVEVHHDGKGIIWPESVSPFSAHLLTIGEEQEVVTHAEKIYATCQQKGIDILYDDRSQTAGEKLNDADLIGIPHRIVISKKTGKNVEYAHRREKRPELLTWSSVERRLTS